MKKPYIKTIIFLFILLTIAFCGQYMGQLLMQDSHVHQNSDSANWHRILHEKLEITPAQDIKLAELEKRYSQHRQYLEEQMKLANMELAEAIKTDKSFSLNVQAATDKIHHAMGELQKITLEHLFDMRPILSDEQNKKLEQLITDALYEKK